jgi:hypothetical protein
MSIENRRFRGSVRSHSPQTPIFGAQTRSTLALMYVATGHAAEDRTGRYLGTNSGPGGRNGVG